MISPDDLPVEPAPDPVRKTATVEDRYGQRVYIGTDYGGVTIGQYTFDREGLKHLSKALLEAVIEALAYKPDP